MQLACASQPVNRNLRVGTGQHVAEPDNATVAHIFVRTAGSPSDLRKPTGSNSGAALPGRLNHLDQYPEFEAIGLRR